MVPVTLYDTVTVEEAPSGIRVSSDDPGVPDGPENTCHRAAAAFMEWAGAPRGVRISVRKRIPAEAGLGGGSSDAAATFKGLGALTGTMPPDETLASMAAAVGADVPFFLHGGPALAEGIGDRIRPVPWEVPFFALIVKPSFGLSTKEGYARLGRAAADPPPPGEIPAFRSPADVAAAVANDFEAVWGPDRPEIVEIKEGLLGAGAFAAGLSGSGSAVFGLFEGEEAARGAQGALARRDDGSSGGGGRTLYIARNL